jgi:phage baseplate assembly protein W
MSSSFLVSDGDLVLAGSELAIVSGVDKLAQDLQLWMKEVFGYDRFHPTFGSTLDSFIGLIVDQDMVFYIKSEVQRVLLNYQNSQLRAVQRNPELYSDDELLDTINSVNVVVSYDRVIVRVAVTTVSGIRVTTNIGVS